MTVVPDNTTDFTWRMEAGEDALLQFSVLAGNNSLYPITGWVIDAKVRNRPGGTVLYTWPDTSKLIIGGGAFVQLLIPAAVSLGWDFTTGWYRVKVSDPSSDPDNPAVQRILQGPFIVDPD